MKEIGKQQFPEIDEKFAPAAAASTMFDPVRIKWLQTALNVLGATPPLDVDGEYGPMTKDAVLQFQKAHDLVADGWAGDATPPRCSFRLPRSQNRRKTLRSPDKGHAHQKLYALGTGAGFPWNRNTILVYFWSSLSMPSQSSGGGSWR